MAAQVPWRDRTPTGGHPTLGNLEATAVLERLIRSAPNATPGMDQNGLPSWFPSGLESANRKLSSEGRRKFQCPGRETRRWEPAATICFPPAWTEPDLGMLRQHDRPLSGSQS